MLFLLVLCSFNFYFKIMWPSPTKLPPSSPQQYTPHQNKNFYPLPPQAGGGSACPVLRLCRSSKDNDPGWILSLVYTIVAWWAQVFEDMTDFRPSQKQMPLLRKLGYYRK